MGYVGNTPASKFLTLAKQNFSTSATTSYTLDSAVSSTQDIALFINNVRQSPVDAYTVSGTALTLTSATAGTDEMYCVYLGKTVGTVVPGSNTITNAMMTDDSVGLAELSATGTPSSSNYLRGDNSWASAGLTGWSTGGTSNSLIPSATDQGIYLGVSSATASNLLDDYEEGTWTPVLENYGNTDYTITGARYTKIGRYVFVACAIVTATPTDGSENFRVSGFPYTSLAYEGGNSNGGYIKAYKNVNTNFTFPIGSGSTIAVMYSETGTNVTYSAYGNVKKTYGSWVYEVA